MNRLRNILNKHDPIGIYFGKKVNFDEYDSEIKNIYKDFRRYKDFDQFCKRVYSIFKFWFGADVVGDKSKYDKLSKDLYLVLKIHFKNETKPKILPKR